MTPIPGVDSAFAPNLAQAQSIYALGYRWWGVYVGGSAAYHVWTPAEVAIIQEAGFLPLPIVVPNQSLAEDPATVAAVGLAAAEARSIYGVICFDFEFNANPGNIVAWTAAADAAIASLSVGRVSGVPVNYTGDDYLPAGVAHWDPLPGRWFPGDPLAANQAVQFGGATLVGVNVDVDMAGPLFPLASWTPVTPVPPKPKDEEDMLYIAADSTGTWLVSSDLKTKLPLTNGHDVGLWEAAGAVALTANLQDDSTLADVSEGI